MSATTSETALSSTPNGIAWNMPQQSRILPFALFMAFIAVEEGVRLMGAAGLLVLPPGALYYLYPLKALSVALLLWFFRKEYRELRVADLAQARTSLAVCGAGIATFLLWICMDWTLTASGAPAGFDPTLLPSLPVRVVMTGFRVFGAVLVVPLMEELFWRSFLLRYLISAEFHSVPLGRFTWSSFLIGGLLFGLEHHFLLAGVAAGMIYSIILYKTRSLAHCILAHAVTNLALACYVLSTNKWYFW